MTQFILIGYCDGSWHSLQPGDEMLAGQAKIAVVTLLNHEPSNPDLTGDELTCDPEFAATVIDTLEATGKWQLGKLYTRPLGWE